MCGCSNAVLTVSSLVVHVSRHQMCPLRQRTRCRLVSALKRSVLHLHWALSGFVLEVECLVMRNESGLWLWVEMEIPPSLRRVPDCVGYFRLLELELKWSQRNVPKEQFSLTLLFLSSEDWLVGVVRKTIGL